MNETLTLADGTVIAGAMTVGSLQGLWIHVRAGMTFAEAYGIFADPLKTARIESDRTDPARPGEPTVFEGFTDLYMLKLEETGSLVVGLHEKTTEEDGHV